MDEPMYSPDGNFIWDGNEWVPVSSDNKQTVNMKDSVIGGDVVSNTNIQSSDAEVIKAAMEGVVASIRELNKPQIDTENPPLAVEENTEPEVEFVPAPHFPSPEQVNNSSMPIPTKKILVAVSIVGVLLITTVLAVLFLGEEEQYHPIVDRWYAEGAPENQYIEFFGEMGVPSDKDSQNRWRGCSGTFEIGEDNNRDGRITNDEKDVGMWECHSDTMYANTGWIVVTFEGEKIHMQYHVSKNLFVWEIGDNGDTSNDCEPLIREGFQQSESSMQVQADLATPPSFCVLDDVDW